MEGKLVKTESTYHLVVDDKIIASMGDSDGKLKKISLKNCQAIENGYDLDDKISEHLEKNDIEASTKRVQVIRELILEIIGDKKFTEEQVRILIYNERNVGLKPKDLIDVFLKNEWNVEIQMEEVYAPQSTVEIYPKNIIEIHSKNNNKPKLDADGCLILKRK